MSYLRRTADCNIEKMSFEVKIRVLTTKPSQVPREVAEIRHFRVFIIVSPNSLIDHSEPLLVVQSHYRYGLG